LLSPLPCHRGRMAVEYTYIACLWRYGRRSTWPSSSASSSRAAAIAEPYVSPIRARPSCIQNTRASRRRSSRFSESVIRRFGWKHSRSNTSVCGTSHRWAKRSERDIGSGRLRNRATRARDLLVQGRQLFRRCRRAQGLCGFVQCERREREFLRVADRVSSGPISRVQDETVRE